jgi:exosome complex component MTR3
MVLQADGGLTSACIIAFSLALADTGVELYGMVPFCCVAIYNNCKENNTTTTSSYPITCVADPTVDEINNADGVVTLAVLYNCSKVTFWNQTGRILVEASSQALELCKDGCHTIYQCMKQCLLSNKEQS